jgi:general secretion pathway protein D
MSFEQHIAKALAIFASLAVFAASAGAQTPAEAPKDAPAPAPRDPNGKVTFTLQDADITELVRVVGEITGRHFIVASGKAKGIKATVYSPEKVTVAAAYRAFLAILQANGLTVMPEGPFEAIVDSQDISRQATPVQKKGDEHGPPLEYVTRIHKLSHVDATEVTTNVLTKFETQGGSIVPYEPSNLLILTDTAENVARMMRILEQIDVGGPHEQVFFQPLFYVPGRDLEKTLSGVFDVRTSSETAKPGEGERHAGSVTKVVGVDRPNALIIVGTEASYLRLLELVKRIDVPSPDEGTMHVVPLGFADAKKVVTALNEAITGVAATGASTAQAGGAARTPVPAQYGSALEGPARVSAEDTTNSLLVTSSMRDFAAIREVIRQLDKPKRQVYIEAVVMDVSTTKAEQLGLSYHVASPTSNGSLAYGGLNPLTSIAAPTDPSVLQGFAIGVRGPSSGQTITLPNGTGLSIPAFGVLLNAMMTSDDADILQTPHIMATDNAPAEIKVQLHTQLSAAPTFQSAAGAAAGSATAGAASLNPFAGTYSTPYGAIGPDIKITPHISESNEVRLDIDEQISDLVATPPAGALSTATSISYTERDATTTMTVKDEETVVIGGLVHDKVEKLTQKIPFLGDIPVIGALFRSTTDTVDKENLVLILTPYIIREPADLRRVFERKMQERQEFIDHEAVFGGHTYEAPKDWSRKEGLIGDIRAAYEDVAERRASEEALAPKGPADHAAVEPIELPAPVRAGTGAAPSTPSAAHTSTTTPPAPSRTGGINVTKGIVVEK